MTMEYIGIGIFNHKYRQIFMESKEIKKIKRKKGSTGPISSLSNLNIRIVDRVIISWVRSTYFLSLLFSNF